MTAGSERRWLRRYSRNFSAKVQIKAAVPERSTNSAHIPKFEASFSVNQNRTRPVYTSLLRDMIDIMLKL